MSMSLKAPGLLRDWIAAILFKMFKTLQWKPGQGHPIVSVQGQRLSGCVKLL
jgi:hypothetical protein